MTSTSAATAPVVGAGVDPSAQLFEQLSRRSRSRSTSVPGPCSAWASRSSASGSGSAPGVGDHDQVARPGEAVDPDLPEHLPLGLLNVQVSRADDHVDRLDRLGAVRERRDRLRPAHPVDAPRHQ